MGEGGGATFQISSVRKLYTFVHHFDRKGTHFNYLKLKKVLFSHALITDPCNV